MTISIDKVIYSNLYVQPIHFTLTILTNIMNIRILYSRNLRLSPCTYYFLAYAILSIIYACLLCPTLFLRALKINIIEGDINCRLSNYLLFLVPYLADLMLLFASFDRYCSSSRIQQFHSASTIRTARLMIIFGSIVYSMYMIPMLFISQWDDQRKTCLFQSNLFVTIYIFTQVIQYCFLSPLLMTILGFLTILNIQRQTIRVTPSTQQTRSRRIERNLARMLILQVGVHLIFTFPYAIIYSMHSFVPATQTLETIAIRFIFIDWEQCDYFLSFFLYILSSKVYRRQFRKLIFK